MKKICFIAGFLTVFSVSSMAQTEMSWIDNILTQVEKNNGKLKALLKANDATMAERNADNSIGETSVEYSPFYQRGVSGLASSELVVSQDFDFPTLYGARKKSATLQQNVLEQEYGILRRDIITDAAKLCYDLAYYVEKGRILAKRRAMSDSLVCLYDKRMKLGDATIMDLNRVKLERMNLDMERAVNDGEAMKTKLELERLGATQLPADDGITDADSRIANSLDRSLENSLAQSNTDLANQELKVSRQGWLPRLTVGYRHNTEVRESLHGFLVGVSMPLFSNHQKVKAARLRINATEEEREYIRHETENRQRTLKAEAQSLSTILSTYDSALMQQTLATMFRAVSCGEMSVIDYFTEADGIYSSMITYLDTKRQYRKVTTEIAR